MRIHLPALRERPEDISPLWIISCLCGRRSIPSASRGSFLPQVRAVLTSYAWPGNIRELSAWVERLYVTGLSPEILLDMLMGESDSSDFPASAAN